jgi:hypothetical protein
MIHLKYFEGYLNESLYKEISHEDAQNFTRESVRKKIKEAITKDDYVKIHKFMYKMFDAYPISKINNETKDDFEIEAKVNAEYIFGNKEESDSLASRTIEELLEDGRMYFSIKKSNPHGLERNGSVDINLYKTEGDVWIFKSYCSNRGFEGLKYYQLEGIEGLEDMIKNRSLIYEILK